MLGYFWNGQGEQFPLPRGQRNRKPWTSRCTSAAATWGEGAGMSLEGLVPRARVRSLLLPSVKRMAYRWGNQGPDELRTCYIPPSQRASWPESQDWN